MITLEFRCAASRRPDARTEGLATMSEVASLSGDRKLVRHWAMAGGGQRDEGAGSATPRDLAERGWKTRAALADVHDLLRSGVLRLRRKCRRCFPGVSPNDIS